MTIEEKQAELEKLREAFSALINVVVKAKGGVQQKNQAVMRLDEGHMWMQNAIMTYQEPAPAGFAPVECNEIVDTNVNEPVKSE